MDINADPGRAIVEQDEKGILVKRQFLEFLNTFRDEDQQDFYSAMVKDMCLNEKSTLYVNYEHMHQHSEALARAIETDYYRIDPYLREATREFVLERHPDYGLDDKDQPREFYVAFHNLRAQANIRDLVTSRIGTLLSIKGTVVRTSAVHPELISGTFECVDCRAVVENEEQQFKYSEPSKCPNGDCQSRSFKLLLERSKFIDFQKARVQETSDEIPSGSMPRSVDIILRHEAVERAKPGDKVCFTGTLIVIPDVAQLKGPSDGKQFNPRSGQRGEGYTQEGITGLKALGVRDMTYKLAFLASMVQPLDQRMGLINIRDEEATSESVVADLSEEARQEILAMKDDPEIYNKLARSIAPTVFGHEEVKRGILLMLFGGVHKETSDAISLRGDINVCIIGDPSTAKSQFLKYVVEFVPRAVYTSGRSSTAAGLTAAVVKDEDSNEFYIEAGALMLADNGICCIDEFDKMDQRDQVAIHEAMEQQTISITKAGIQATLNARTSILAAANPIHGRYDRSKSLKSNVTLTAPIMSRFDLFFIIIDDCNEVSDYNIAKHITSIHRYKDKAIAPEYTTDQLQRYIRFARTLKPRITPAAKKLMVEQYRNLRQNDSSGLSKSSYRITVRQLESMVRLSEALARLHCDDEIKPKYVHEACRLLRKSIIHVESDDVELEDEDMIEEELPGSEEPSSQEAQKKQASTISYELYSRIAHQLIHHLRQYEDQIDPEEDDVTPGIARGELITWYMDQHEEFESAEEAESELRLVGLVIQRLVTVDGVLLELSESEGDDDDAVLLAVHPNYVME